ncbi:MAG: universal stress protein [Pseudomonadota bacterium]
MAIKSIFVPFFEEKSAISAFRAAVVLAQEYKAHISIIHMRNRPMPPATVYFPLGGVSHEFVSAFQEAEEKLADTLKRTFDDLCRGLKIGVVDISDHRKESGVTASWDDVEGELYTDLAGRAMSCDLAVIATASDDTTPMEQEIIESLLFKSGRPVLMCPQSGLAGTPKKIVVAWNGRQEAARAVSASMDLLQDAEDVSVVTVRKSKSPLVHTEEITTYLRLHNVNAVRSEIEIDDDESDNARLDAEVLEQKPDLLVMGAYSHSRWREAILGGYTRHMIHEAKLPVFMMR